MNKQILTVVVVIALVIAGYLYLQSNKAESATRTFNLSEYGISLTIPTSLKKMTYVPRDESEKGPGTVLHMFTENNCELGALYQIRKDAVEKSNTTWTAETLEQFTSPQGVNPAQVKEFTDFYLVFEPTPTPCATDEKEIAKESKLRTDLWNALVSARFISY